MLYYLKIRGSYIKEDSIVPKQQGRRKKFTFEELVDAEEKWDLEQKTKRNPISFQKLFNIVEIDQKYEEKQDELERQELIRREFEVDDEQMKLF